MSTFDEYSKKFENCDFNELLSIFSDAYKDSHGFRPRIKMTREEILKWLWNEEMHFEEKCKTFEGREELRAAGYSNIPEETDPEKAQWAKWLENEREIQLEEYYGENLY